MNTPGQEYPSLNSMNHPDQNDDGSYTIFVGPNPAPGEKNWIKSVPGKGWFSLFRFYGPKQEFFDRAYKPGDFIRVNNT